MADFREVWVNRSTGQVEAVNTGCFTDWGDPAVFDVYYVPIEAPGEPRISRDHKVVIEKGEIVGLESSPQPLRPPKIEQVKEEAQRRILARFPDWKQRNMLARATELQENRIGRLLTTEEDAEITDLWAAWAWIKSVRAASDVLEATLPTDFRDDKNWPTPLPARTAQEGQI